MGEIMDLGLKFSGMGWIWDKVDGYKSYLAAFAAMLTGLLGLLDELIPILNGHKIMPLIQFIRDLPQDQSWLMVVGGLAVLGISHKIAKASETADINAAIAADTAEVAASTPTVTVNIQQDKDLKQQNQPTDQPNP